MTEPATAAEDVVASGLSDGVPAEPEKVRPEVVEVDTSRPRADDEDKAPTELPDGADVVRLPVTYDEGAAAQFGGLFPVRDEMKGIVALAVTLATASTMPKALRDKPADILAVILTGRELGVSPMTAIRTFHVIDGTVTIAPKVRAAMVHQQGIAKLFLHQPPRALFTTDAETGDRRPLLDSEGNQIYELCPCGAAFEDDPREACTWHAQRKDTPAIVYTSRYTQEMAGNVKTTIWSGSGQNRSSKTGSLLDKDNWINYRERMLSWRALGYLIDDACPEVGTGLYSPDELGAVTDEDGTPILDVTSTESYFPKPAPAAGQPERPPEANPEVVKNLRSRIANLKRYEGASTALAELWVGPDRDAPRIAPLDRLPYQHERMASAAIDTIERRVAKGEFGEPTGPAEPPAEQAQEPEPGEPADGEPASAPTEASDPALSEPESAPEAPRLPPPPFDVESLPTGTSPTDDLRWLTAAPDDIVQAVVEEVKALDTDEVNSRVTAAGLKATGPIDKRRQQLAARTIRQRMERLAGLPSSRPTEE